jgi:hypothetical protein
VTSSINVLPSIVGTDDLLRYARGLYSFRDVIKSERKTDLSANTLEIRTNGKGTYEITDQVDAAVVMF